jgi:acyl dehydratase
VTIFAEEIEVGAEFDLGCYHVSRTELVTFAEQWDPHGFHTHQEVAARGHFGDVIASGAHTLAIAQRLAVLGVEGQWAVLAGVELRQVRFVAPVRPDTTLHGSLRVEAIALHPPQNRGLVTKRTRLWNGDGPVLELVADAYVYMRQNRP